MSLDAIRPLFVCGAAGAGVTPPGVCSLPHSAEALAAASTQGADAWTDGDGNVEFSLGPQCCWTNSIEERCNVEGTGTEWRQVTTYYSNKIVQATGPWEGAYPPSDWNPPCDDSSSESSSEDGGE
jgi:hypothetical protein